MGCGCGKKFAKPNVNVPIPTSVLAEAARRTAERKNADGLNADKKSVDKDK